MEEVLTFGAEIHGPNNDFDLLLSEQHVLPPNSNANTAGFSFLQVLHVPFSCLKWSSIWRTAHLRVGSLQEFDLVDFSRSIPALFK